MPILNPDIIEQKKNEILQRMADAFRTDNIEQFNAAWGELQQNLQDAVMAKVDSIVDQHDTAVLAQRGVRQLTSEERTYFEGLGQAMMSSNPQQAVADYTPVLPKTTIDQVFVDLIHEHPLLEAVSFQNTGALIEIILNTNAKDLATWGTLTATITKELSSGFKKVDLQLNKLSAFMPVPKSMIDLGPEWLDRYVRDILVEALAFGLENAIITGTGKDQPIGMDRQVGDDVVITGGVYPQKSAVALTSFKPAIYGAFLAPLTTDDNGNSRKIENLILICNPTDYLTKVMPATTLLRPDGSYASDVFPVPTKIIQSVQVPSGKAIIGLAKRYFMGIGTSKGGKLEYSDEYKFLEDARTYLIKLYGHGLPLDNGAFIYTDISNLEPAVWLVEQVTTNP